MFGPPFRTDADWQRALGSHLEPLLPMWYLEKEIDLRSSFDVDRLSIAPALS